MSGIPLVIRNITGKHLQNFDLEIDKISCIIGSFEKDKEEIINYLYKVIPKKHIRIIPRYRINIPLSVEEVLRLYERNFGKRITFLDDFLDIDKTNKVSQLSEFERFKLELAQVFFGTTKLLIVENFLDTFEEQMKDLAIKLIIKATNLLGFRTLFFFTSMEFQNICERTYVIYGGKLLEYTSKNNEFYHPYSQFLKESVLSIGKKGEKIDIEIVSSPALRGCPFHDYCKLAKNDRRLFRACVTTPPPKVIINSNEVYCWYYELGTKRL